MKKLLLTGMTACFCFAAVAQKNQIIFKETLRKEAAVSNEPVSTTPVSVKKKVVPVNNQNKSSVISVIDIGQSANALTSTAGPKGNTDYNPATNLVTFIHRSIADTTVPNGDPTNGYYRYDVSKDGGATWDSQQGPIYADPTGVTNDIRGRYPQAVIINPPGNTVADSAYLHFFGVATTATPDWTANLRGTRQISGLIQSQEVEYFVAPFIGSVTNGLITTQNNIVWNIDGSWSSTALASTAYTGTQYIYKGTWNSVTNSVDYTRTDLAFPTGVTNDGDQFYIGSGIHFGADGTTGYLTIIANNQDFVATDSANLLTIYKTTDGGATWGTGTTLKLDTIDAFFNLGTNLYETGFEQDGKVDANGNLHLIVQILPSNGAAQSIGIPASEQWGMFDIFTTDGGGTWKANMLGTPLTYRGTYGPSSATPMPVDNRGQVSTTWALDKFIFTWGDTDTNVFGGDENLQPNIFAVGYDITTGMWTPEMDLTVATAAEHEVHLFNAAPYVIGTSGTYEIPITYTAFDNPSSPDPGALVHHKYLKGATIDDSQFTVPDASLPLGVFTVGIEEPQAVVTNSMNIFPNPGKGATSIEFTLKKTVSDVKVEITNTLGQVVYSNSFGTIGAGFQKVAVNTSELGSGIYFCSLIINGEMVTKKLAVE